ncbi:unnamed protein product [Effrenium voratum]|nr:unnamed protein product [Effrenium voratum]
MSSLELGLEPTELSMELGFEDGSTEDELLLADSPQPSLARRAVFAVGGVCLVGVLVLFLPQTRGEAPQVASRVPFMQKQVTALDEVVNAGPGQFGMVDDGIYTYGAPGTASTSLADLSHEDGCFAGLRVWTEDVLAPSLKQEDGAAISDQLNHPKVATLRLHEENVDSHYKPCPGEESEPFSKGNKFADWRLHWEPKYKPRLGNVTLMGQKMANQAPFNLAYGYNRIAYKQYDSTTHAKAQIKERLGDSWNIVARWTLVQGAASMYDEDPMMLVQDSATQKCVVAFAGINNYGNELATATDVRTDDFCGFKGVHAGYRDELMRIVKTVWPKVQPLMGKCSHVACTGHSMGGSLCDLFSACANSGRVEDPDFKAISWIKETPAALPEISDCGGAHYEEDAEHRCERFMQRWPSWEEDSIPVLQHGRKRDWFMDVPGGYGYGFIDCEETKLRFTRDVYLHRNQMEGLQIGDEVSFSLMFNAKGEPQARNVMKLENSLLTPAAAAPAAVMPQAESPGTAAMESVPLLCDVAKNGTQMADVRLLSKRSGQLLELGFDYGINKVETTSKGVQTVAEKEPIRSKKRSLAEKTAESFAPSQPPATQVLRLAVGLLGLEVHEKPNTWAEVWLSFQDSAHHQLGLSSSKLSPDPEKKKAQADWQQQVLSHLRELASAEGLEDQLDLAEFALKRITHSVNVLEDPERFCRPMLVKDYSNAMATEVCNDLRQWLEQLAKLLSFYHIFILDLEHEKGRLLSKLQAVETKQQQSEEARRAAVQRAKVIETRWKDVKMKARAEAVLGIDLGDEDEKIYSQREVDELFRQWTEKHLKPLMDELEEKRKDAEWRAQRDAQRRRSGLEPPDMTPRKESGRDLLPALEALEVAADKAPPELAKLLLQVKERLQAGAGLKDLLLALQALPSHQAAGAGGSGGIGGDAGGDAEGLEVLQGALACAAAQVKPELGQLLRRLGADFASGPERLANTAAAIRALAAAAAAAAAGRSVGVNTTAAMVPADASAGGNADFQAELRRLRAQLEAELKAAREETERQRLRAEEAMKKLEEEAKRADEMMNDMRQKLKTMEGTLQKSGLGGHTETAVSDAGLPDFAKGRDVFHRLYKDALRRMQVQAENYLRMLSHTSAAFLKVLDEMAAHPIAAVNEALQIHGPPQLLAPLQVLGYSAEVEPEAAPPHSPESPHERPRPRKLKTSSSLGRERSEARLGRAKTNPALPRSSSQTLRQTLFPSPGPPMPPGFGGGEDSTPSGWAASPDRMDVRPGTGHRRGFPQLATPTNSKERRPSSSGSCRGPSRSPFGVFSMARTGSEGAAEARANKTNGAGPAPRAPEKRAFLHDR